LGLLLFVLIEHTLVNSWSRNLFLLFWSLSVFLSRLKIVLKLWLVITLNIKSFLYLVQSEQFTRWIWSLLCQRTILRFFGWKLSTFDSDHLFIQRFEWTRMLVCRWFYHLATLSGVVFMYWRHWLPFGFRQGKHNWRVIVVFKKRSKILDLCLTDQKIVEGFNSSLGHLFCWIRTLNIMINLFILTLKSIRSHSEQSYC